MFTCNISMNKLYFSFFVLILNIILCDFSFAGNPFVWNLLWTQLEIWIDQRSSIWTFRDWKAENALSLQQQASSWKSYDLISELDKAKTEKERLDIINQYINLLSSSASDGNNMYNYENSKVDYYNNLAKECESPIKAKNSEFSNAVKSFDYERAETISNEIAELRACVAKNEVLAKAHATYASAARSAWNSQKKIDYLTTNKEKIAKYYEILKPDLLKELYDISKTVNSGF